MSLSDTDRELDELQAGRDLEPVYARAREARESLDLSALDGVLASLGEVRTFDSPARPAPSQKKGKKKKEKNKHKKRSDAPTEKDPGTASTSAGTDNATQSASSAEQAPDAPAETPARPAQTADASAAGAPDAGPDGPQTTDLELDDILFADLEAEVGDVAIGVREESTSIFSQADIAAIRRSSMPPPPDADAFEDEVTDMISEEDLENGTDFELFDDDPPAEGGSEPIGEGEVGEVVESSEGEGEGEGDGDEGDKKGFFKKLFG